jgi:hypothetical protein
MYLREVGRQGVDWMHLTQDRNQGWALVSSNEPLGSIKSGDILDQLSDSFSRKTLVLGIS